MRLFATSAAALFIVPIMATGSPAIANSTFALSSTAKNSTQLSVKPASTVQPTPAPAAVKEQTVTVQPGDYLTKVAETNNTTSLRMFYANPNIANPDLIFPNEELKVPTATETLAPREVPTNQQMATPTTAESTQAAAPRVVRTAAAVTADGSVWDRLAACEAGGNWSINTGNGFYGGLQFTLSSWQAAGGTGYPNEASRDEQIARGQILQARQGWGAWPACTAKLGIS